MEDNVTVECHEDFANVLWGAKKKCAFTNKLARHGFWTDGSMELSERKLKAKLINDKRKQEVHKRINAVFDRQTRKIRDLQNSLAKRQNIMALEALHRYSTYKIQCIWRRYVAKKQLYLLRLQRLVKDWLKFRRFMRERYNASRKLTTRIKQFFFYKKCMRWIAMYDALKKLRNFVFICINVRKYKLQLTLSKFYKKAVSHIILFAISRATRRISYKISYGKTTHALQTMLSAYGRRKRLAYLRGPNGKVAFHYLTYQLVEVSLTD